MPILDFWPGQLVPTSHYDQECRELADRHYNRQSPGAPQFAGNGPKLVLRDTDGLVVWVWLNERHQRWDGQAGYYCQLFRNESPRLSSLIVLEAEQHAISKWGPCRMFTYVDPSQVRSTNPGYCYLAAGWHPHGYSKSRGRRLLVKYDECDFSG
jgi:hypothetical protein